MKLVKEHIRFERPESEEDYKKKLMGPKYPYDSKNADDILSRCMDETRDVGTRMNTKAKNYGFVDSADYYENLYARTRDYIGHDIQFKILEEELWNILYSIIEEYTVDKKIKDRIAGTLFDCIIHGCPHQTVKDIIDNYLRK